MRTRDRHYRHYPSGSVSYSQKRINPPLTTTYGTWGSPGVFNDRRDVITDKLSPKRSKEDRARLQRRLAVASRLQSLAEMRSVKSDLYTATMTVNPCQHDHYYAAPPKAGGFSVSAVSNAYSFLFSYSDMAGFLHHVPGSTINSKLLWLRNSGRLNSVDTFHSADWFALLDRWHEVRDNFVTPVTNIGESIVENGVFVDAFKTILNPSRALIYLCKFVKGNLGNKRYSSVGKIGKLLRDVSDSNLSFQFGVKPALDEIQNIVNAHKVVTNRLKYLRENAGGYVPIRAAQRVPSEVSDYGTALDGNIIACVYNARDMVASISALGKVRPDLSYAKDWKGYVQFFGLHKVLQLGWELIPFSFVIDWVTNAQEYINQYVTPNFDGPFYNLRNFCHSVRYITESSLMMGSGYIYNTYSATRPGGSKPVELCRFVETSYNRASGLPMTSGSVDISRLGLFHGITGSSLLIQKLGKLF